jgi:apolipoprotein N-acyltransferase
MYERDEEFQAFISNFASKHNAYVLFNSAEPNAKNANFYNSAIMVNPQGEKIGQYDKIHLVPFGEYAPVPSAVEQFVPTLVGNFQYGENYDLFPFGEARGGIMICYESHFASLSREFVKRGADVLIEMTNDGYLGNTPVLRQHLANAVFRAVETNRPVLRVTNVGVTAYVNERGEVFDAAQPYTEDTRVWTISKSDGKQTVYVRYGEWFAWLCSILSLVLLSICFWNRKNLTTNEHR